MDFYKGTIPIIDDSPDGVAMAHPGSGVGYGAVPRDYDVQPEAMFDGPESLTLDKPSDWDAIYDEQEEQQSSLEHLYLRGGQPAFVNLDQDGLPDCWMFSTAHAMMLSRLRDNQPLVRYNPHAGAVLLDQLNGGWCGLSAQLAREKGLAVEGTGPGQWPGRSRSRSHDTPELRIEMAKHKSEEYWIDLTRKVYDQTLSTNALATCLNQRNPSPIDSGAWGHSICALRWARVERGVWRPLILNSWLGWGRFGLAVISGRFFESLMGAVCLRTTTA